VNLDFSINWRWSHRRQGLVSGVYENCPLVRPSLGELCSMLGIPVALVIKGEELSLAETLSWCSASPAARGLLEYTLLYRQIGRGPAAPAIPRVRVLPSLAKYLHVG
jgi:hypothetical protein